MKEIIEQKKYEDHDIKIEIEKGILYCTYKNSGVLKKDVSDKMIHERIKISNNESYPVLMCCIGIKYWTLASRTATMKELGFHLIDFTALVIDSKAINTIWKFATSIFKPPVNLKVFYNIPDAEKWLLKRMSITKKRK